MDLYSISTSFSKVLNPKKSELKSVPIQQKKDLKNEKVEISEHSAQMQRLKSLVEDSADIRLSVVKVIKARIKSNDYPIENNLDEIVKKMIQNNILKP